MTGQLTHGKSSPHLLTQSALFFCLLAAKSLSKNPATTIFQGCHEEEKCDLARHQHHFLLQPSFSCRTPALSLR